MNALAELIDHLENMAAIDDPKALCEITLTVQKARELLAALREQSSARDALPEAKL